MKGPPEPERRVPGPDPDSLFGFDGDWVGRVRDSEREMLLGRVGSYDLLQEVGRGGQGVVYRAKSSETGEVVAIKRMLSGALSGDRARVRFEREIEILSGLSHPGIVNVRELDSQDGLPSLAMEWVEGTPITRWCRGKGGAKSVRAVLERFVDVCAAVEHAHRNGVLHRDLKPSNILVDSAGSVRVLDFGIARVLGGEGTRLTRSEEFVGTPVYASPEQLSGESASLDTRSDVYSLGVVLYEMLTGELPSPSELGIPALFEERRRDVLQRPSPKREGVDLELDAIVIRALRFDPELRYQSVAALGEDVRRHLNGEVVLARIPGVWGRLGKAAKRNPVLTGLGLALLGSLLLSLAIFAKSTRRLEIERDLVAEEALRANAAYELLSNALTFSSMRRVDPGVTVLELVIAAAKEIDQGFSGSPRLEADLRFNLGVSLHQLDALDLASEQIVAAMALADSADPALWISCAALYGLLQSKIGELEGLSELLRQVVERADTIPNIAQRATALHRAGQAYVRLNDQVAAEAVLRRAMKVSEGDTVDEARALELQRLQAQRSLASLLVDLARPYEAQELLTAGLQQAEERGGQESVDYAHAFFALTNLEEELDLYESDELLERRRRTVKLLEALGNAERRTHISARRMLAVALIPVDPEEAGSILGEIREQAERLFGRKDSSFTTILRDSILLKFGQQNFEEALPLCREAREVYLEKYGGESANSISMLLNAGTALLSMGDLEGARVDLEEAVAATLDFYPVDSVYRYRYHHFLVRLELEAGNEDRARDLLAFAWKGLDQATDPSLFEVARTYNHYDTVLMMLGDPLMQDLQQARIDALVQAHRVQLGYIDDE